MQRMEQCFQSVWELQGVSGFHGLPQTAMLLAETQAEAVGLPSLIRHLTAATIFSVVGILVLLICVYIFDRIAPFSFRKEILEDQNTALGIIVAALLLGISIIIAAAILG